MADLKDRDLQRLRDLENRLVKSREEAKSWTTERRELLRRVTAAEKEARRVAELEAAARKANEDIVAERRKAEERIREEVEKNVSKESDKLTALVEENRRVAGQLATALADVGRLTEEAQALRRGLDAAKAEVESGTQAKHDLEARVRSFESERDNLQSRLTLAEAELRNEGRPLVLSASEVGRLVSELINRLRESIAGVRMKDGEIKLKVAFSGVEKQRGFVVPTPESGPEIREMLHELTLHFESSGEKE